MACFNVGIRVPTFLEKTPIGTTFLRLLFFVKKQVQTLATQDPTYTDRRFPTFLPIGVFTN
jgi:hypothetical protein